MRKDVRTEARARAMDQCINMSTIEDSSEFVEPVVFETLPVN